MRRQSAGWDVQTFDYNGYLFILVTPTVKADKQTSFFLAATAQRLKLFKAHDGNMTSVASFDDVEELSVVLLDLIARH